MNGLQASGFRLPAALLSIVLLSACQGTVRAAGQATNAVREPAVAGQFYPADARTLGATLDAVMKDAVAAAGERPVAIIAPHAGYVYSGQIAADAWNQAAGEAYDTIVILGTNHTTPGFDRIGIYPGAGLRTPLGTARVDQALSAALAEVSAVSVEARLAARYDKFRKMGEEGVGFIDTDRPAPPPGTQG